MNCQPIYLKNDPFRIAYVANGNWQLQRDSGHDGTNARKATKTEPKREHFDRWQPVMRPMAFKEAQAALNARDSQKAQNYGST
jgi:hypothetical protein